MLAISLLLYCSTESDEEDAFISRESRFNGATAWVKVSVKWHLSPDSSEEEWSEPRQCHFLKKIIEVSFNEFCKSVPSSLLKVPENKKRDSLDVKAEAAEIFNHVLPLLVHSVWNQRNNVKFSAKKNMWLFCQFWKIVMTERIFFGPSLSCLLCNIRDLARMKTEELQQRTKKPRDKLMLAVRISEHLGQYKV